MTETISSDVMTASLLSPGTCLVQIRPRQEGTGFFLSQCYDGVDRIEDATPVEVAGDGTDTDITFHLVRGGEIRGELLNAQGQDVGGTLILTPANRQTAWAFVNWSGIGVFRLRGLPDGAYKFGAVAGNLNAYTPGLPVRWYNGTADWDSATVITIQNHGIVSGIDVRLP